MADRKSREDKIRELKEKLRRLEEQPSGHRKEGAAREALKGLGEVIPGLGRILQGLEDSESFQERLEAIDKELDERLGEAIPHKGKAGGPGTGIGKGSVPRSGAIPRVERGFSIGSLAREETSFEVKEKKGKPKRRRPTKPQPIVEREVLVDIFEEDGHLKIIAELPGVEEEDVIVELGEDKVVVSAESPHCRYRKEVPLPCSIRGEPKTWYRNGILEIELTKGE